MGNISGREEGRSEVKEEYMDFYGHGEAQPPDSMVHSPPRVYTHLQSPYEMMQIQDNILSARNMENSENMHSELGMPTMITWCYDGKQVAIQGSWDGWKTRDFLQKTGEDFSVLKVLPPGIYHFRFIVDGQWRYSLDFPHERDDMGNVFNVLDVKGHVPPVHTNMPTVESPSSPVSSYKNSPFTIEDFDEKLPEVPPLLQKSLLDQPSSSNDSIDKPLPSMVNHLYVQKGRNGQSFAGLSSTERFRSKYVTLVLYKPVKKAKK